MVDKLSKEVSATSNRLTQRIPGLKQKQLYPTQIPSIHSQLEGDFPVFQEFVTDEYDNLQLETHPLNLLFFLKKVEDEEIIDFMSSCVSYIFEKQQENRMSLVNCIYAEEWVITKLPEAFFQ